ncbi:hypothetical protein NSR00_04050 [Aeribacillus sp. FSL K6-8394]
MDWGSIIFQLIMFTFARAGFFTVKPSQYFGELRDWDYFYGFYFGGR